MFLDLHRHLEGSHSARALALVARELDIRKPPFFNAEQRRFLTEAELAPRLGMPGPSDDAAVFYRCIELARAAYVSEEAIGRLAFEAFMDAASETDGLEMRVSLFSMTRTLLGSAWRQVGEDAFARRADRVLRRVLVARDQAQARARKPMLVRVGFSRTFESASHTRAMADVLRSHAAALCGLDVLGILPLAADKEPLQPALVTILQSLRNVLPDLTIHAGEFEDHRSVERALALEPHGIGHGVHSVGSSAVMQTLSARKVTLEVCPSSNALLIPTALHRLREAHGGAHPLRVLQRHNVRAVLGSDDPVPMNTSFTSEIGAAALLGVDLQVLERDMLARWQQITGRTLGR